MLRPDFTLLVSIMLTPLPSAPLHHVYSRVCVCFLGPSLTHAPLRCCKVTGLGIIGRLFSLNPELYLPSLQAMLVQLVTVLLARDATDEAESLVLLSRFTRHVPWLVVMYGESITRTFITPYHPLC